MWGTSSLKGTAAFSLFDRRPRSHLATGGASGSQQLQPTRGGCDLSGTRVFRGAGCDGLSEQRHRGRGVRFPGWSNIHRRLHSPRWPHLWNGRRRKLGKLATKRHRRSRHLTSSSSCARHHSSVLSGYAVWRRRPRTRREASLFKLGPASAGFFFYALTRGAHPW